MIARTLVGLIALSAASAAWAQWVPGSEITGQHVTVQTNGILNNVYFEPGGVAEISSPSGAIVVPATGHFGHVEHPSLLASALHAR